MSVPFATEAREHHPGLTCDESREFSWQGQATATRWIFGLREAVKACVDRNKVTVVGYSNRRQWWMFRADAVVPDCVPKFEEADE